MDFHRRLHLGAMAAMSLRTTTAARGLSLMNARLNTVMTSEHDSVYCKQKQAYFLFLLIF